MTAPTRPRPLHRELGQRVAAQWKLKFVGITAFITAFFFAYFALLRFPIFPVTTMPLTSLDRWVPFEPAALGLYLSLWFYVSLPPTLLRTKAELHAYGWISGAIALIGLGIFFFWPTAIPASTGIEWTNYPGFTSLKSVDAAQNACPSLHVAFAVFSGVWLDRIIRQLALGAWARWVNVLWAAGIVYSTLATRQHVAIDVVAGTVLGLGAGCLQPAALRWPAVSYRPA